MIPIKILTQPSDTTCGPTSLHAVYNYYGMEIPLKQVISEVSYLEEGGTLAVMLGIDALKKGFKVKIYTYNLLVFDPTWFSDKKVNLIFKLQMQLKHKKSKRLHKATKAYIEFLENGGQILFKDLNTAFLKKKFEQNIPILTGLSATYLYNCSRERTGKGDKTIYDDVKGFSTGHFVVLCGYDREKKHVIVADPYKENPFSGNNYYSVKIGRLINSIMLGIVTYDANLLIIEKQDEM
ncbi:MAG: C39 family peptidase [Bacteroidetes bacterium]|nr:C39 family peptidase [Bacteroidota bacterium]